MLHSIVSYLKFLMRSTNQHGVHSPFVYNLITACFYDKTNYNSYRLISTFRKHLKTNKQALEVKDLGSGSRVFNSNKRSVSKMAKNVGSTQKETKLLYRLVNYFQSQT